MENLWRVAYISSAVAVAKPTASSWTFSSGWEDLVVLRLQVNLEQKSDLIANLDFEAWNQRKGRLLLNAA